MFTLKAFALLALAFIVIADSDLDKGLRIMNCARNAILTGVPELNIPPHEPYVVIKHNFSWSDPLGAASINLNQMTWSGLARWNLTASQLSQDSDSAASFDFDLYWKWMSINGSFQSKETLLHQEGKFAAELAHSDWIGSISLTKPTSSSNGTVDSCLIDWHVKDVTISISGLGIVESAVEASIKAAILNALNEDLIGNTIGDFIKMRLETFWWNTGKVWDLVAWCNANNIPTIA